MKSKNYAVVLLPMTIEVHWSYFLLFVAKDREDGNRLKLGKNLETVSSERYQKLKYEWLFVP